VINLFDDIPTRSVDEIFTEVFVRENVRIERIVSIGQSTPTDQPHRQRYDEWVLLLAGLAGLRLEGEGERNLRPGDHVLIPAHRAHLGDVYGERAYYLACHTLRLNPLPMLM
jgi:cupin 2 domain-containing protein